MTKAKAYCLSHDTIAVRSESAFSGVEVKGIEWEDGEQYMYYVDVAGDSRTYHRAMIKVNNRSRYYITRLGRYLFLDEIVRV
jgi:hypothetical protein